MRECENTGHEPSNPRSSTFVNQKDNRAKVPFLVTGSQKHKKCKFMTWLIYRQRVELWDRWKTNYFDRARGSRQSEAHPSPKGRTLDRNRGFAIAKTLTFPLSSSLTQNIPNLIKTFDEITYYYSLHHPSKLLCPMTKVYFEWSFDYD